MPRTLLTDEQKALHLKEARARYYKKNRDKLLEAYHKKKSNTEKKKTVFISVEEFTALKEDLDKVKRDIAELQQKSKS